MEPRTLLTATETFTVPSLSDLIAMANAGQDTAPAAIDRMLDSLESQLKAGPLADLNSGAVDGDGFVREVQGLESSYEQGVDQEFAPEFPNVDEMLKLDGQAMVADVISLNQQYTVGLISSSDLIGDARKAIDSVTVGPINTLSTPASGYASATKTLSANLTTLAQGLSSPTAPLSAADVGTTLETEAEAYRADLHAGLEVEHPNVSSEVDSAANYLDSVASAISQEGTSATSSQLSTAIGSFDSAMLGKSGVFGSGGAVVRAIASNAFSPNLTIPQTSSAVGSVSGTANSGGTATLTATLSSPATGQEISGETINFTLNGAFAGQAVTDSDGIATLSGVATGDAAGTDTGGITASFAGDINDVPSSAAGDLVVSPPAATLASVAGTSSYGGTATLTATLQAPATSAGVPGETVSFTLDGTPVGTAVTDTNGVATLTGVATTDAAGTDTGGVVATFAGDTTYGAASAAGNLVVSQAGTTLGSVSGTATVGGTATLNATLTSTATDAGVSGETVSFTLDGTSVGTAVTGSNGVATLTGVATSDGVGTDTNGVVASFAGDTNDTAAASATGNLLVTQGTSVSSVTGTAIYGGDATLTAMLTATATSAGISGETVSFTLDGTSVGSAVTDGNGVATLTGVTTSDAVGTDTNGVGAGFAGDGTNGASSGMGNLVVSQAPTTLGSVSGTASYGGTATLTATLMSSATDAGVSGETVSFTLDGTSVGSAVTDSSGVAVLSGITTAESPGTVTNDVIASFAGDANYLPSQGTGDLTVTS